MIRVQRRGLYGGKEFGVVLFWLSILLSMAGRSHAEDARSWLAAERAKTFIDKNRNLVRSDRRKKDSLAAIARLVLCLNFKIIFYAL